MIKGRSSEKEKLLIWLSIPIVFLISLQAPVAKAEANWGVSAYVAGTMLAVWVLVQLWPKGLRISLIIGGVASFLFPLATIFAHQLVLPGGNEVMKRYLGRSEISREAGVLAQQAGAEHHCHRQSRFCRRHVSHAEKGAAQDLFASACWLSCQLLRAGICASGRSPGPGSVHHARRIDLRGRDT